MSETSFFAYVIWNSLFSEVSFQMLVLSGLVALFAWYVLKEPAEKGKRLSKSEEEDIIKKFEPDELIPAIAEPLPIKHRIISSKAGKFITINGHVCLNLATHNYLSFVEDAEVEKKASESINKYGVGSCGPRGFYGTVDVHLDLEEKLAEYMEVEEACVYSYGFATMASAIPAYCKRGDVVFVDKCANFSIQKGLDASRSQVHYFEHNNMSDLESLLVKQQELDKKNPRKAAKSRRFLIVEGIYINTGNICDLPRLIEIRKKYKLRILLDESVSFGAIGKTGRGVVEYFDIPNNEVDLRIGSMEGSLASIGGFCCGASFIVEHQRLSGSGYCFSASLPPLLAVAAITSLDHMKKRPELFEKLKEVSIMLHEKLQTLPRFIVSGHPHSPIKHLYFKEESDFEKEQKLMSYVEDYCMQHNIGVVSPPYLINVEKFQVRPSLRITANVSLTLEDLSLAREVLHEASESLILSV